MVAPLTVQLGVSPIAWINDDMPELGADTPLERVLEDARDLGFAGVELGGAFPRRAAVLKPLLASYGLALVGGWYGGRLLSRSAREEMEAIRSHLELLEAMGSDVLIYAETSNAIHGDRAAPLSATPRLSAADWRGFGARLTDLADHVQRKGFRFAYHHHLGTVVENGEDLDQLLAHTGEAVGLTIDTGHAALAGFDPSQAIRAHPSRVRHVHCKDIRGAVAGRRADRRESFLDGVLAGVFTVPGDGDLDFAPLMNALADIGYVGWIIVEAEQDPRLADPRAHAEIGLRTLRREAHRAGLKGVM